MWEFRIERFWLRWPLDFEKPDKTHTLYQREIAQKKWPLPVSALFTCGHSSAETLHKLGILTIGDLAKTDPAILEAHLKSHGRCLWQYANGIDDSSSPGSFQGKRDRQLHHFKQRCHHQRGSL